MTRDDKIMLAIIGFIFIILVVWAQGAPVQDGKNWVGLASEMTSTTAKWTDGSRYFTTDTLLVYLRSAGSWSSIGVVGTPSLDQITNPAADKTFTMANKTLTFNYTAPTPSGTDGAFEIQATGGFTGDLVHLHQHTGNPGAGTDLLHVEATDSDVTALRLTHSSATYTAANITGKVNITGQLVASNVSGTNTGDQTVPATITCSGTDKLSAYSATTGTFTCSADVSGGSSTSAVVSAGAVTSGAIAVYSNTTGTLITQLTGNGLVKLASNVSSALSGTGGYYVENSTATVATMPRVVWASANQSFTSTTAAASSYLTWAVNIGNYTFECFLPASNTTTSAIRFALALPASSTLSFYSVRRTTSATALVAPDNITAQWASTCTGCTAAVTSSVIAQTVPNRIFGYFTTTASGSATVYAAISTAGQTNTLNKGAYCMYQQQ